METAAQQFVSYIEEQARSGKPIRPADALGLTTEYGLLQEELMNVRRELTEAREDLGLLAAVWEASVPYRCTLPECRPCRALDAAEEAAKRVLGD